MKQLLRKYKLVGSLSNGKYLIPGPPLKTLTPFLIYLVKEQKKIKSELNEKAEQQDIVKLLNIKYKTLSQEEKQSYAEGYKVEVQKYFQARRDYENQYNFSYYKGVKTIETAYQYLRRSSIKMKENEAQSIQIINEKFGKLQHELYNYDFKDATEQELELSQQIFHLITLHQIQIKLNCEWYKVPSLFNAYSMKQNCQNFVKTYVRYQRSEIPFQQFLVNEVKIRKTTLEKYLKELQQLSIKHNQEPEKLELALVCLIAKETKVNEEASRKRKLQKENTKNDFIDLLSEYLE